MLFIINTRINQQFPVSGWLKIEEIHDIAYIMYYENPSFKSKHPCIYFLSPYYILNFFVIAMWICCVSAKNIILLLIQNLLIMNHPLSMPLSVFFFSSNVSFLPFILFTYFWPVNLSPSRFILCFLYLLAVHCLVFL